MGRGPEEKLRQTDPAVRAYYARRLGHDPSETDAAIREAALLHLRGMNSMVNREGGPVPKALAEAQKYTMLLDHFNGQPENHAEEKARLKDPLFRTPFQNPGENDTQPQPQAQTQNRRASAPPPPEPSSDRPWRDYADTTPPSPQRQRRGERSGRTKKPRRGKLIAVSTVAAAALITGVTFNVTSGGGGDTPAGNVIMKSTDDCQSIANPLASRGIWEFVCHYPARDGGGQFFVDIERDGDGNMNYRATNKKPFTVQADGGNTDGVQPVPVDNGCIVEVAETNESAAVKCP